jgi:hypothetical protein
MVGLVAVIVAVLLRDFPGGGQGAGNQGNDGSGSGKSYATLMEEGKDAMQAQKWAECAKIFNEVIEKNKDSKTAREWKQSCIMEADAQKDSDRCAAAIEKRNWKEAMEVCKRIPRSSRYYNAEKLQTASGKLCEQYIAGAQDAAKRKDYATVVAILEQIGNIHEAPPACTALRAGRARTAGRRLFPARRWRPGYLHCGQRYGPDSRAPRRRSLRPTAGPFGRGWRCRTPHRG